MANGAPYTAYSWGPTVYFLGRKVRPRGPNVQGPICQEPKQELFLSDPGVPGPIYGLASLSLSTTPFADLTDVTLAEEDTIPILIDNANRAIQGNVAMHVTLPGGQL